MRFDEYLSGISVDCVIFGFHDNELKVLLLKLKKLEEWMLPGGFIRKNKNLDEEASVVLESRTGLSDIYLKQFYTFGNLDRNDSGHADKLIKNGVIDKEYKSWFDQRYITVGYFALVEYSKVDKPQPDYISEKCEWVSINDLPPLLLDHKEIILKAHQHLSNVLEKEPVSMNLLPEEFTMPELQSMYETILQYKLDRRNFRRRMLNYGILIDTGKSRMGAKNKAPIIYRFDKEKYGTTFPN